MESVRPRSALEQKVRVSFILQTISRGASLRWLLVCFSLLWVGEIHAHGLQYLLAKVTLHPGSVEMEITADFSGNPMIETEAAARQAIADILTLRSGPHAERKMRQEDFQFSLTDKIDPTSPVYLPPPPKDSPHQLLIGKCRLAVEADAIRFAVPKGNPNDAILWITDAVPEQKFYLIAGDHTADIAMPIRRPDAGVAVNNISVEDSTPAAKQHSWLWVGGIVLVVGGYVFAWTRRKT